MPSRILISLSKLSDDAALAYLAFEAAYNSPEPKRKERWYKPVKYKYLAKPRIYIQKRIKVAQRLVDICEQTTADTFLPILPNSPHLREEIAATVKGCLPCLCFPTDKEGEAEAWGYALSILATAREQEKNGKKRYLLLSGYHDNGEGKVAMELPTYQIRDGKDMDAKKLQDLLSKLQKAQDAQKKTAEAVAAAEAEAAKIVADAKAKATAQDELVTTIGKEIAAEMGDLLPKPAKAAKAAKEGKRTRRSKADVEAALATLEKAILHVLKGSKEPLSREALLSKASTAPVSQADWTKVKDKLLSEKKIDSSGEKAATVYTIA